MARSTPKITAPAKVLEKVRSRVEQAKEDWANNTVSGFMSNWSAWYSNFVVPALMRVRLPPKTGDIKQNVVNRVTPVAQAISKASEAYRRQKLTELAPVMPVSAPGA